jgi:hypothetical protein
MPCRRFAALFSADARHYQPSNAILYQPYTQSAANESTMAMLVEDCVGCNRWAGWAGNRLKDILQSKIGLKRHRSSDRINKPFSIHGASRYSAYF